ncbi:hypothetical protein U9M48_034673 [Paspalum notatum var. saurae]|uniref:Aminotransferase-like plant mobile domain-containing protein n=1 Tax=Paspalum notatum var. saurae TaxID=547442 RepID=A0AAQ3X951_PASNO
METMALDHRWLPRLRASGLLPLARLVEGDRPRFSYDFSLPAALVDGWRSETHTFHLLVGEMAPTLRDVSYLLGLPLRGDAMGPTDVGQGRREDLLARFGLCGVAGPHRPTGSSHRRTRADHQSGGSFGSSSNLILTFYGRTTLELVRRVRDCRALGGLRVVVDRLGDVLQLRRQLCAEAPIAFRTLRRRRSTGGDPTVQPGLRRPSGDVSWLVHGLFEEFRAEPIFGGCPLLLQLWAHEMFQIGRPAVLHMPYRGYPMDDVDGPTMGSRGATNEYLSALTLKLNASQFAYAHVQTRKSYPDFVGQFDVLRDDEVRWEPYSHEAVDSRAPEGLSPLCVRDAEYWRTRSPLVFDIYVEEHAVHRVLRQFGLFQEIVVPTSLLPPHAHRFTRRGRSVGRLWTPRLAEFVARWTTALDDVVMEGRPHDDAARGHYLRWYLPRTRVRVLSTPQELPRWAPDVTDSYPTQRDQGASLTVSFFTELNTSKLYLLTN